ncbi:type II secretion system protein [Vibrio sinensis]|uniref:Type II secretion system protein n=1 Tax=Vibrio sinensis TaxID=2302434 RepID=A0A3A6QVC0_9VIBR|nr:type II secretion system protein [Vibrio sinensis]RJX65865.1 type II secretion system protein [Vibrio sinensis]
MKGLKKQQGFAMLASMSIVLGVVVAGSMWVAEESAKRRILNNSESFYQRVIYLRTQIHAFVNDRYLEGHRINGAAIFPHRLGALEPKYIPTCSSADNQKGFCMLVNQTPWGMIEDSDYRVVAIPKDDGSGVSHYRAEFDIKLPDKNAVALKYERQVTLAMLAKVPNVFYDDTNNILTVRIDRPDKAFGYESLVKRSGDDSTLLGDWDVGGNHAIVNTRDITIRNSDNTQKIVSRGLSDIATLKHGEWLDKPSCPEGTTARIWLALGYIEVTNQYTLTGSQKPFINNETTTQWQIGLVVRLKENSTGRLEISNAGEILAITQCK